MTVPLHLERVEPVAELILTIGRGELVTVLFTEDVTAEKLAQVCLQLANLAPTFAARQRRRRPRKR